VTAYSRANTCEKRGWGLRGNCSSAQSRQGEGRHKALSSVAANALRTNEIPVYERATSGVGWQQLTSVFGFLQRAGSLKWQQQYSHRMLATRLLACDAESSEVTRGSLQDRVSALLAERAEEEAEQAALQLFASERREQKVCCMGWCRHVA
jgi:hypothetical protein